MRAALHGRRGASRAGGRIGIAAWCAALALLASACGGPTSTRSAGGPTSTRSAGLPRPEPSRRLARGPAKRIVSVVPAVTEMLFAIGAGPNVVAVSSYDDWPPEVRSLTRVGALLDPDVERILRLQPDLVVVYGTQAELRAQLGRAGIPTFAYTMGGLDNLMATIRRLGPVVGRAEEADRTAAGLEARFDAIRRRVAGLPRPRTLLVFSHEPGALRSIDASGGSGFLADIVELAGGDNVFGSEKRESLRVSTESILAAAPEVVIDLLYGRAAGPGELKRDRAAWATLPAVPAVRNGRVAILVGDEFVVPGPRLADAAEAIAAVIHPGRNR